MLAGLVTARADAAADRRGLKRLALWCNRFTPWCAVDASDNSDSGNGGLLLDITDCAHLFGGEAALMDEVAARLAGLGIEARLSLADTSGAAWALAHPLGDGPSAGREVAREAVKLDTFGGTVHVEWNSDAAATPLGELLDQWAAFLTNSLAD